MDPTQMTTMSLAERRSFEQVGNACQAEVQRNCGNSGDTEFLAPMLRAPLLDAHQQLRDSMRNDFGSVMDHMMRSVLDELPAFAETEEEAAAVGMDNTQEADAKDSKEDEAPRGLVEEEEETHANQEEDSSDNKGPVLVVRSFGSSPHPCHQQQQGDLMVRHMLSQFLPVVAPEETPLLAHNMAAHGHSLLQQLTQDSNAAQDDDSRTLRIHMARRLSEVTPEEVMEHSRATQFLPFSTEQNDCLRRAYQARVVSVPCGQALQQLDQVRSTQFQAHMAHRAQEIQVFGHLLVLYALVLATAVALFWRRKTLFKVKRKLASNIFSTIYSRPQLKHAVEQELGHSIGATPPMPRFPKAWWGGLRRVRFATLVTFTAMSVCVLYDLIPVSAALQVCIFVAAFLLVRTLVWTPAAAVQDCKCCCCNASPDDAKAGLLTAEQACCGCCQGTGVCCAACASCCGTPGHEDRMEPSSGADDGCCCCGAPCCANGCCGGAGGCCCCGNSSPDKTVDGGYVLMTDNKKECCGGSSDNKTRDVGTSCCGDATKDVGTNTNGCCGCACCSNGCCGGAGCSCCCSGGCCTNKKTLKPRKEIYEGVPIQIV